MSAGHTLRGTIPCGLNIAAPFNPAEILIGDIPDCPPTILGVPNSSTENEIRRNIFWIAYVLERTQAASNIYAMTLDDLDVCQLLPLRGDQFEQGVSPSFLDMLARLMLTNIIFHRFTLPLKIVNGRTIGPCSSPTHQTKRTLSSSSSSPSRSSLILRTSTSASGVDISPETSPFVLPGA